MTEAEETQREEHGRGRFDFVSILRIVLLITPWAFIAYLYRDTGEIADAFEDATPALLAAALAFILVAVVGVGVLWVALVGHLGGEGAQAVDRRALMRTYARSWIARYIPGVAWTYGARFVHTEEGVPRRVLAASMVDEFAMLSATTTAVGLGLWLWGVVHFGVGIAALVSGLALSVLFAMRVSQLAHWALDHVGRLLPKRFRRLAEDLEEDGPRVELSFGAAAWFTAGFSLVALAAGAGFFVVLASLGDVSISDFPEAAGGANLATIISIAVVVVPAGLGVREATLAWFAAPLVDDPIAATAALAFRFITVVADGAFLMAAEAVALRTRRGTGS